MAYTTKATSKGGRTGRAMLDSGALALSMAFPKEMGGDGEGHNPEQLFALGYATCFNQAIVALAKKHDIDPAAVKVSCEVTLNKDEKGLSLAVALTLTCPGADRAKLEALINNAHEVCPYSKATRGNVPVTLTVA